MNRIFIYIIQQIQNLILIVAIKKYLELINIKISLFKKKLVLKIKDNLLFTCYFLLNLFNRDVERWIKNLLKIYKKTKTNINYLIEY